MRLSVFDHETWVPNPENWDIGVECPPSMNKGDKAWVHEQITAALKIDRKSIWSVGWPLAVALISVGIWVGRVEVSLSSIDNRLERMERSIDRLGRNVTAQQLQDSIEDENPEALAETLREVRGSDFAPTPEDVQNLAELAAKRETDQAWQSATTLANYRSSLIPAPPVGPQPTPASTTTYHLPRPEGRENERPILRAFWGRQGSSLSPILEYIGENRNKDVEFQPITLHALGGAVLLDGLHIRNVVFQDVDVVYEGGPLIMEGVTFVNCTFNGVRQTPSGRRLLLAVSSQSDVIEFQEAA